MTAGAQALVRPMRVAAMLADAVHPFLKVGYSALVA